MKESLFYVLNFLDFWFAPLIILLILAVISEQVIRWTTYWQQLIPVATRIRKFLWQQNLILNIAWFLCYFLFNIFVTRSLASSDPMSAPNVLWKF